MDVRGRLEDLRRRPVLVAAILVGMIAVTLVARDRLADAPDAGVLVSKVNAAYRSFPGYSSTILMGSDEDENARDVFTIERTTLLQDGLRVGFSEQMGTTGKTPTIYGIAVSAGIWLRTPSRTCWTPNPEGAGAVRDLGFGEPILRTSAGIRYERPERTSGGWKLRATEARSARYEHEYVIDPDTFMIQSATTVIKNGIPEANRTVETIRPLSVAPDVAPPLSVC